MSRTKHRFIAFVGTIALVGGLALGTSSAASAKTVTSSGCTGGLTLPGPTVGGTIGLGGYYYDGVFSPAMPRIDRAPCYTAYTQNVRITMLTWGWKPTTQTWQRGPDLFVGSYNIAPGKSLSVGSKGWQAPSWNLTVMYKYQWRLLDGTLLGTRWIDYDRAADYSCPSSNVCTPYADSQVGGYIHYR